MLNALLFTKGSDEQADLDSNFKNFFALLQTCNISIAQINQLPNIKSLQDVDIIFIDLDNEGDSAITDDMKRITGQVRTVLFNADESNLYEKHLLLNGFEGVFYHDERPDIVLRGITQLQKNERWFKRETMNQALTELMGDAQEQAITIKSFKDLPTLTRRENAIIRLVSSGAKNQEIADQLHISPNTVKTHLYSIFRKTSSRNRVELITYTQKIALGLSS